ncbi:MAG: hypothetical protein DCC58_04755 [Chloroflexi bacterium]|nr:MAG: hypothetical protein DCC58_04755 [Chloroflexota bacterium]
MSHSVPPVPEEPSPAVNNPFAVPDMTEAELAEARRLAKRRIAFWGVATGALMALLVLICIGLIVAAQGR